ncbi:penicillin-binding transpeptidase domain-containing protein [Corynebacterium auriscanis]|uniref:Penicillin-binding protein n=1 Tax=Corynebacterium auriscanis TaxID=99807 RepID=A0A0A2DHA2_9CORY|nr:penicillin-binding protein 2 [Corynebacterium auriscanis]KGM18555.1 penicillin-binding protein [Corynebacterium auriscanis]WJY71714.1 Penicillin-binding protein A [Corynebacterium auriscanis]
MNRSIRAVTIFSALLIVALIANLTYIQAFQHESLAENPRNARQYLKAKSQERGQITAGGQIVARSEADEDGYYHRYYPTNPAQYGAVVGYFSDRFGASGLEASQNSILNGTDDSLFARRAWDSLTGKEIKGANVDLTLLPNVQKVAYEQLANRGYSGSVVAIRPSNGEILAMASTPSFNPSEIVTDEPKQAEANFAQLSNSDNAPLLNRSTQQTQPPGSTFKVVTTAAALMAGDNENTMVTGANQITLPGTAATLENYGGTSCGGGGQVTLMEAFRRSCNTAFVDLSTRHGADALRKAAKGFGVGEEMDDVGLPVQRSTLGEIPDDAALGQTSIGQRDAALTPLQNAVIAATVANGGKRMEPHLIKKITGSDLKTLKSTKPKKAGDAMPRETADQLTKMMLQAESYAGGQDSTIASKTGTAEHGEDSRNSNPHAWYIAFSTQADVAVAVLVENGGDRGQAATGGSVAGPIGREVINAARQELK